jgi:hypothetical protein
MTKNSDAFSELALYVAFLVEQRSAAGMSLRKIGKEFDVTHAHLSNIASKLSDIGQDFENSLAMKLTGGSRDELSRLASEWREQNPDWLPSAYKKKHGSQLPYGSYQWWKAAAMSAVKRKPQYDWAIDAAGKMFRGPQPRVDKRNADFVLRLAEQILDLPDEKQTELENAYRARGRQRHKVTPPTRPSGAHAHSRS